MLDQQPDSQFHGALRWVKDEIIMGLRQVREQVEQCGQDPELEPDLSDSVTVLTEVRGVLVALQLHGAASLVQELADSCRALAAGTAASAPETIEAMILALIQLPDHLDRFEVNGSEDALGLLPAINDLRGSRGDAPLSPAELLVPPSVLAAPAAPTGAALEGLGQMARKVRPRFYQHLLEWFRGADPSVGLSQLARLFNQLYRYLGDGRLGDLFRAAERLTAGLVAGEATASSAHRTLIGGLDEIFKPLALSPPEWPASRIEESLVELIRCLDEAQLDPPLVRELRATYQREEATPDSGAFLGERPQPPRGQALADLASEVHSTLGPIKERLEQFVRVGRFHNPAWLADLEAPLAQLADRLATADCADLADRLLKLAGALGAMGRGVMETDELRLLDLAEELLALELAMATLEATRNPARASQALSGVDRFELLGAALREALTELNKAKQAITDATAVVPIDRQRLAVVPDLLFGCARPLELLDEAAAGEVLDGLAEQCRKRYLSGRSSPDATALELIADTLAGIELYLEGLAEGISYRQDLIEQGRQALAQLDALPDEEVVRPTAGEPVAAPPSPPEPDALGGALDGELREIFLEEARDEWQTLAGHFNRLSEDPHDAAAVRSLRRSFHTLKGSGRLVGAIQVAELARLSEAVLNRVIDQGLTLSEELRALIGQAVDRLPELIKAEEEGSEVPISPLLESLQAAIGEANGTDARGGEGEPAARPARVAKAEAQPERPAAPVAPSAPEQPAPATSAAASGAAIDPELAALFIEDARDLIEGLDEAFRAWRQEPEDRSPLGEIRRQLHTLKGAARLAEIEPIADLSHGLETLLIALDERERIGADNLDAAQRAMDALSSQVDDVAQGRVVGRADQLVSTLAAMLEERPAPPAEPTPASVPPAAAPPADAPAPSVMAEPPESANRDKSSAYLRIRVELLNELVDQAAEMRIDRERMVRHNGAQRSHIDELDRALARLREQLRQFDRATQARLHEDEGTDSFPWPEEEPSSTPIYTAAELPALLHNITETVADLACIDQLLADHHSETAELLEEQAGKVGAMLDGLLDARMVPFRQVVPRLERLVRQTAEATGKPAQLVVSGGDVELDRSILERMLGPFEHLLRNALVHGIETTAVREAAGKPTIGTIRMEIGRDGNDVVITLSDDGGGMDTEAIRRKACARGLIAEDATLSEDALVQLTLEPGFSTAKEVTQLAGRGVGLDAVMAEVRKVNGGLSLSSQTGRGMRFRIRLPLTLAMIDVLLVEIAEQVHAVPYTTIEGVARIGRDALVNAYGSEDPTYRHGGESYRLVHLGTLLRPDAAAEIGKRRGFPLLLVRSGEQGYALQVDGLREGQRIVVKPLGPLLSALRTTSGGTILPDGQVALVLDLPALLRSPAMARYRPPDVEMDSATRRACVMVVDDSLTTRRANIGLLRAHGLDVITAKDGVEALTLLEERVPDLFLLDIDMPRMDGYELTRHIRRSPHWGRIPIVVSSSRAGPEHSERCAQLGVSQCFGKPYDPAELTTAIDRLLIAEER